MQKIKFIFVLILAFLFTGCLSKIGQVKDGKFLAYSTTTIGEAFDASFGNVEWTEKTSSKGQDFVEFKGDVDVDFLELLAAAIVSDVGEDLANPFAASNAMDACLGKEFAQQYRQELAQILLKASISSLGLIALDGNLENNIKAGAKADFVSTLANKSNRLTVQFVFTDNGESDFELGYYGFEGEEWSSCSVQRLLHMKEFLDFVYSSHTYSLFDYKGIAKEIVDQAEAANQLPDSLLKEKISSFSKVKGILISNAVKKDPRVIKRKEDVAKAAVEQKKIEEEEALRKEEEAEAQRLEEERKRRDAAMKQIVPTMKTYKKKMDDYKNACADGGCDYPEWNVIGYKPPESNYFEFNDGTRLGGYDFQLGLDSKEDVLGINCHWIIRCHNMEGCSCNVSEDCKDITPNLKSLCDVEYDSY
jgi:hypothetical protein